MLHCNYIVLILEKPCAFEKYSHIRKCYQNSQWGVTCRALWSSCRSCLVPRAAWKLCRIRVMVTSLLQCWEALSCSETDCTSVGTSSSGLTSSTVLHTLTPHKHTRRCLACTEIATMFSSFNRSFFKYFHSHSVIITFFVDLHGFRAVNLMGNTLLRPYQSLKWNTYRKQIGERSNTWIYKYECMRWFCQGNTASMWSHGN